MPGAAFKCSSRVSRLSKMRASIRCDCASCPMRGSRLVGLLSMIITSVLGSVRREQERENKIAPHRQKCSHVSLSFMVYGYEIFPRTAARFAPVAEGTFDGL